MSREMFSRAISDIQDLIDELELKKDGTTGAERREIEAQILLLEGELAKLKNQKRAFRLGTAVIAPPDEDNVNAIKALLNEVDDLIARGAATREIINVSTRLLQAISEMQSKLA